MTMETKRVVIDCDPALGVKSRDVDDGLAILLLLASTEVTLEGITVNFGNVKAPLGYKVAQKVVEVAAADTPVFIERWPAEIKAFYMRRDPESPGLALCSDLLAPEGFGEIIGGSERETDHDELQSRMKSLGMPMDEYQWYLDLRKYGSVPHSGFGIGLERTVGWMAGSRHVRECIPFPRMISRVTP